MQTRSELRAIPLGVMACALAVRVSTGDEPLLRHRMRRLAAVAGRLPPGFFEMRLLRPLRPVTLNTIGRRTARTHSVTLVAAPFDDGLVVTTCMGPDPDWIRNLRFTPRVEVVMGPSTLPVEASFPEGRERALAAAAFADCHNPVAAALVRRLLGYGTASPPQLVVLSLC